MAIFIVHWPCLLISKLSCMQKSKAGHTNVLSPQITGNLKIMCCMKHTKGIANWNMQWHLPLCMTSQLINYPFQASLTSVDSNLKQYCYWLSTKRQFIFQNKIIMNPKRSFFKLWAVSSVIILIWISDLTQIHF